MPEQRRTSNRTRTETETDEPEEEESQTEEAPSKEPAPPPREKPVTQRDAELEAFQLMREARLARDRAQAEVTDRETEAAMRETRVRGLQSQATAIRDQIVALANAALEQAMDARAALNLDLLREQVTELSAVAEDLWVETEDYRAVQAELTAKREALVRLTQERHAAEYSFQNTFGTVVSTGA